MSGILAPIIKLFSRKKDDSVQPPPPTENDLFDNVALTQEDIIDRVVVDNSAEAIPSENVGSLAMITQTKGNNGEILEIADLRLGGEKYIDYSKVSTRVPNKVLLRHIVDRKVSSEVGFLSFISANMSAESLAEVEVTLVMTASLPPIAIKTDELWELIKEQQLPENQYYAIAKEAALINTSVKFFNKVEAGANASYGFNLGGSAYALSEYTSNKSFLAIIPRRFWQDNRKTSPKPLLKDMTEEQTLDMLAMLPFNNVTDSTRIKAYNFLA
jgi:hypothetical protein